MNVVLLLLNLGCLCGRMLAWNRTQESGIPEGGQS